MQERGVADHVQNAGRSGPVIATQEFRERRGHPVHPAGAVALRGAVIGPNHAKGGVAQPCCLVEDCVKHRSEIAGRGIDDLEHLGGGGLPLQRLVTLGSSFSKLPLQIGYELFGIG